MQDIMERFWAKVNKTPTCWLWTASVTYRGYGRFQVRHDKTESAHRFVYERLKGPIPIGLVIDHLCRNTLCVNPDHLEAVTTQTNIMRGIGFAAHNAAKTQCPKGHPYDLLNTLVVHNRRVCHSCAKLRWRDFQRHKRSILRKSLEIAVGK